MISHLHISAARCACSCPCVGYFVLAVSDIVFNLFYVPENLINLHYLLFGLLTFHVTTRWGGGVGKVSCFSEWLCSFILSFIKIIVVSKKTQCDLEAYVLSACTLEGAADGNRQCLGQSAPERWVSWGCVSWWISPLSSKTTWSHRASSEKKKTKNCDPKYLTSFTHLTRGVNSPHCAPPVWLQIALCSYSSVATPSQYCLLCSVTDWLPTAGKSPEAMPASWVKP